MLRLILRDLRNMLRRPVVSLLLLIGLIVGGFAMVVYFCVQLAGAENAALYFR